MNALCLAILAWALGCAFIVTLALAQWAHRRKATDADVFHGDHHGER